MCNIPGTQFDHEDSPTLSLDDTQIQTLMNIDTRMMGMQTTVLQLNEKLIASEAKLENVQASAIKLG
jgi:hypothetical protein